MVDERKGGKVNANYIYMYMYIRACFFVRDPMTSPISLSKQLTMVMGAAPT